MNLAPFAAPFAERFGISGRCMEGSRIQVRRRHEPLFSTNEEKGYRDMKKFLFAVFMVLLCNSAFAFMPTPGLWYNPAESGRGFTIDHQNNVMVVASYVYDTSGKPLWYLSAGAYNDATNTFTATFDRAADTGQCLGCPYTGKPAVNVGAGGTIRIVFDTAERGTIYYPGGSSPIQHYLYAYDASNDPKTNFYGKWVLSFNSSFGLSFSDWVIFNTTYTATDGKVYLAGYVDGDSSRPALATYDPALKYIVSVYQSASLNDLYNFTSFDGNRATGSAYIQSGGTLGSAYAGAGFRLLTGHQVQTGVTGLSITATSADVDKFEQLAASLRNVTQ